MNASFDEQLLRFVQGRWAGARRVQGIQGGARAFVIARVAASRHRPMLVLAPSASDAEDLYDDLAFFLGEERDLPPLRKRLHLLPSWEVLPFEKLSPPAENLAARLEALYKIIEDPAPLLISTPAALMQRVLNKEAFKTSYLYLVAGQDLERESLIDHLSRWGFQNVPLVEELGDFSVRGGIVDIYSPGYARPLRLEFEGDRLESVRQFNPSTQRSEAPQEDLLVLPMKEFSLKRGAMDEVLRVLDQRAADLEMDRREKHHLLDTLREGIAFPGIEYLAP
jgi:transcription-repair coupling factor (superfamily II helicase)